MGSLPEALNEDSVCSGESAAAERQPCWARGAPGSRPGSRRLRPNAGQLRLPPAAAFAVSGTWGQFCRFHYLEPGWGKTGE